MIFQTSEHDKTIVSNILSFLSGVDQPMFVIVILGFSLRFFGERFLYYQHYQIELRTPSLKSWTDLRQ